MIICLVGLRERQNKFKTQVAQHFNAPIYSFDDLTKELYPSLRDIYLPNSCGAVSLTVEENNRILLRAALSEKCPKLYMDWMSGRLIDDIFARNENSPKKVQAVITDLDTPWEYRFLREYLMQNKRLPYGSFKRTNKMILIENDDLLGAYYNNGYEAYKEFEVDGVISTEDENIPELIEQLKKDWKLAKDE